MSCRALLRLGGHHLIELFLGRFGPMLPGWDDDLGTVGVDVNEEARDYTSALMETEAYALSGPRGIN